MLCPHCHKPISRLNNCVHCDHYIEDGEEAALADADLDEESDEEESDE